MLGSFAEGLVNNTIDWYLREGIAYFRKSYTPISILDKCSSLDFRAKFSDLADIDYYGVYKGKYISFEVKETNKDYFLLSQIRDHQKEILIKLLDFSAVSFLLINFSSYNDASYLITSDRLKELFDRKKKKIFFSEIETIGKHIPISFPGVIDFLKVLDL
ncbi:Holliday junction resolvase RecU [Candidatus Mycoplasma haematohominis]|uniref:Holliday junction resolvase RecU n=1 Tax=Candidatus Mycoplasma haematohominis TaxID=1494318 RepID=A0A478FUW6_9MOLU|nr:Holliday junction resolvase RecU [Candidatus Mycoplasma haemohominis]